MKMLKGIVLAFLLTSTLLAQQESLVIGPGDEVHVQVFDTPDLDENARVTDSMESFRSYWVGRSSLASLTPVEAARSIEAALISGARDVLPPRNGYGDAICDAERDRLWPGGKPGTYPIDTPRSVVDVLGLAGGLTDLADRHVTIERHTSHRQISYYVSNRAERSPRSDRHGKPG